MELSSDSKIKQKNNNKKSKLDDDEDSENTESLNSSNCNTSIESIGMKKLHHFYSSATLNLKEKYSKRNRDLLMDNEYFYRLFHHQTHHLPKICFFWLLLGVLTSLFNFLVSFFIIYFINFLAFLFFLICF